MPSQPTASGKNLTGDFSKFTNFMRRLVAVPHSEIKAQLEAEKEAKRTSKASASRASGASPKTGKLDLRPFHLATQFCISQSLP